jgi:hypothetical protein
MIEHLEILAFASFSLLFQEAREFLLMALRKGCYNINAKKQMGSIFSF